MSQENVDLVSGLHPGPDVDTTQIFRDDDAWAAVAAAAAPVFDPAFECVGTLFGTDTMFKGLDGFRAFNLDWLAPWSSYRVQVAKAIDLGEQVVMLYRVFGCHQQSTQDVESAVAWVWTARDGQIIHIKGYGNHADALSAVGLEG